jgi:hypothetical protein
MLRKIQGASDKTNSIESVKWYTIPTDNLMPKEDVTCNTLGFTGTIASGGNTFTLYLDNEGTGAKTYNIYIKNLSGNDKLTLTTGKSGATNYQLSSGNYVGQIYVDENGNIFEKSLSATNTISIGNLQPATSSGVARAISSEESARNAAIENANYLVSIADNNSPDDFPSDAMRIYFVRNYNIGWVSNDGFIINIPRSAKFGFQIALDDQANWVAVRSKANNVWNNWERVFSGRKLNYITGFSYSMAEGYSVTNIQIDNVNFWASGINVFDIAIGNLSGGTIGSTSTNVIGSCNLRPIQNAMAIGMDYVSGRPVRVKIDTNGKIIIMESVGVTQGSNQIRVVFTALF